MATALAERTRPAGRARPLLHARTWTDAGPGAPAVVLVHGFVVSSRYMVPLGERLAPRFRVYAPDLPGFGKSPKPAHTLDLAQLADALAAWMRACGLERAALVGNSFGCQIATEAALRHPDRVERIVLQGPTTDPGARSALRQLGRLLLETRNQLTMLPVMTLDYVNAGVGRAVATARVMLRDPIERKLPLVQAPALVVRGTKDSIATEEWVEQAARLLPNGRLVVVPGAAHAMNWTDADELAGVIAPFLSGEDPA